MATLTPAMHRQLQKVNDPDGIVLLLRIDEGLSDVVRVASDTRNWVSNGQTFIGIPMRVQLPQDVQGETSRAQLVVSNPGRDLIGEFEALAPGRALDITLMIVSRAAPDTIEWEYVAGATLATANSVDITLSLGNDDLFRGPAVRLRYDPSTSPGIFAG